MNTGTITISNSSTSGELDIQGGKIYLRGEDSSNHGGILYLFDKDNTNFIALTGGTGISSNYTITLPSSPPGGNDKVLLSDSSGNLSWADQSSGGGGGGISFSGSTVNGL